MKAFLVTAPNQHQVEELATPVIGEDEVLVKVGASGICHSDYELMEGRFFVPIPYPVIPGHEWAGDVVEVGKNVKRFSVGDRVIGECAIGCGACPSCQSGNFANCSNPDFFGFTINGSHAEYLKARQEWLHKLPDAVSFRQAALIEPFSVAYYGIFVNGGTDASETVAVLGGGCIGLAAVAAASSMGARVVLIEPIGHRQEVGRRLGAAEVIDPLTQDAAEVIRSMTGGFGADLVIEAAGADASLTSTLDIARNNGRISFVGMNVGRTFPVELGKIQAKGLQIRGTMASPYVWDRCITFLARSGKDISPIATHEFAIDGMTDAFALASNRDECIKVMIVND